MPYTELRIHNTLFWDIPCTSHLTVNEMYTQYPRTVMELPLEIYKKLGVTKTPTLSLP